MPTLCSIPRNIGHCEYWLKALNQLSHSLKVLQQSRPMTITKKTICGIILAGGRSSRMGFENKALLELGGKSLIAHVIEGAAPQVGQLLINANRDLKCFEKLAIPVLLDAYGPDAGPLAGIVTGMQYCRKHIPGTKAVACFPADVPWFANDIVAQMAHALNADSTQVAWLSTSGQLQPLFSLWPLNLEDALLAALGNGTYSPMALIRSLPNSLLCIEQCKVGDFENINTPADLAKAQTHLQSRNEHR